MSFILDALRKSENERRLESAPDVMRVPLAVPRNQLPTWAIAIIAVMALALVSLALLWWSNARMRLDGPVAISTPAAPAVAPPAPPAPIVSPQADTAANPSPVAGAQSETADGDSAIAAATALQSADTINDAPAPSGGGAAAVESVPANDLSGLPSATQLAAEGVMVPELSLQLLVNSPNATSRFVMINGRRYIEGDRLTEGPLLIGITADGAALRYLDREFLLVPD